MRRRNANRWQPFPPAWWPPWLLFSQLLGSPPSLPSQVWKSPHALPPQASSSLRKTKNPLLTYDEEQIWFPSASDSPTQFKGLSFQNVPSAHFLREGTTLLCKRNSVTLPKQPIKGAHSFYSCLIKESILSTIMLGQELRVKASLSARKASDNNHSSWKVLGKRHFLNVIKTNISPLKVSISWKSASRLTLWQRPLPCRHQRYRWPLSDTALEAQAHVMTWARSELRQIKRWEEEVNFPLLRHDNHCLSREATNTTT